MVELTVFSGQVCARRHLAGVFLLWLRTQELSALMFCSTDQGKMHSSLFSSALQNRLTAGMCHCNSTCGDSFFIQVCSEPAQMHCSTGLGKTHSPLFSSALQNRLFTTIQASDFDQRYMQLKYSVLL